MDRQAPAPGKQGSVGFEIDDLGGERVRLVDTHVGRIADHQVEAIQIQALGQVSRQQLHALGQAVEFEVAAGDHKGTEGDIAGYES